MADLEGVRRLALGVIYFDEHLIEVEASLVTEGWSGIAEAYTAAEQLQRFAADLARFSGELRGEASFEAGDEAGGGFVALRFYAIDRSGHLACHLRLASRPNTNQRPEEVARLAVEVKTEPAAIERFARGLHRMAESRSGAAMLLVE